MSFMSLWYFHIILYFFCEVEGKCKKFHSWDDELRIKRLTVPFFFFSSSEFSPTNFHHFPSMIEILLWRSFRGGDMTAQKRYDNTLRLSLSHHRTSCCIWRFSLKKNERTKEQTKENNEQKIARHFRKAEPIDEDRAVGDWGWIESSLISFMVTNAETTVGGHETIILNETSISCWSSPWKLQIEAFANFTPRQTHFMLWHSSATSKMTTRTVLDPMRNYEWTCEVVSLRYVIKMNERKRYAVSINPYSFGTEFLLTLS